jgi:hypothetical protein
MLLLCRCFMLHWWIMDVETQKSLPPRTTVSVHTTLNVRACNCNYIKGWKFNYLTDCFSSDKMKHSLAWMKYLYLRVQSYFTMGKCKTVLRLNYTRLFVCANCVGFRSKLENWDQKLGVSCYRQNIPHQGIKFEFAVKGETVHSWDSILTALKTLMRELNYVN